MLLTPSDVQALLGVLPTSSDLQMAHAVIEVYADSPVIDVDETVYKKSDLRKLKLAISFQAVWLMAQPGYEQRTAVNGQSADGVSITTENVDDLVLAPNAARTIRSLSWKHGSRRVRDGLVPRSFNRDYAFDHEIGDDGLDWQPLPGWGS